MEEQEAEEFNILINCAPIILQLIGAQLLHNFNPCNLKIKFYMKMLTFEGLFFKTLQECLVKLSNKV